MTRRAVASEAPTFRLGVKVRQRSTGTRGVVRATFDAGINIPARASVLLDSKERPQTMLLSDLEPVA